MNISHLINLTTLIVLTFCCNIKEVLAIDGILEEGNQYVKAEIIVDRETIPKDAAATSKLPRIGVLFSIKPGWHIYWQNSGDSGAPTKVHWVLPENYQASSLRYPAPFKFDEAGGIITYGYKQKVLLISDLFLPQQESKQLTLNLKAQVNFLACNHVCLPGKYNLASTINISQINMDQLSKHFNLFNDFDNTTPQKPTVGSLNVQSTLSAAVPGSSFNLIIDLDSISLKKSLTPRDAQIFPNKIEGAKIGNPYLLESDAPKKIHLIIPVSIDSSVRSSEQIFSGILVISKKMFDGEYDQSFEWSYQQLLKSEVQHSENYQLVRNVNHSGSILSYRASQSFTPLISYGLIKDNSILGLILAMFAAFIAGIILNVMPCVLPVLSIKVCSFINRSQQARLERIQSAFWYIVGTVTAFFVLALLVIILKHFGHEVGWGFQFQHPSFVLMLALVIFTFSLSMFDIYVFKAWGSVGLTAYTNSHSNSFFRDFLEGILAAVLATPCSAPLLGTALAFAFASSTATIIAVFSAIGLGLAFPFVVLSLNQKLISYLPKPGVWMIYFKWVLGGLLLVTCGWLIIIHRALTVDSLLWVLLLLGIVFSGLISLKLLATHKLFKVTRPLILVVMLFCILLIWPYATIIKTAPAKIFQTGEIQWAPYSEELLQNITERKLPVFIVFTADWCLTCKFNEKFIINTAEISEVIKKNKIVTIKADWTTGDEKITKALNQFGGRWVPYYVAIPSKKSTIHTPGPILTKSILTQTLSSLMD